MKQKLCSILQKSFRKHLQILNPNAKRQYLRKTINFTRKIINSLNLKYCVVLVISDKYCPYLYPKVI